MFEIEGLCPNCGSENIRFNGKLAVSAPVSMINDMNKRNLRSKDVEIMSLDLETIGIRCADCKFILHHPPKTHMESLKLYLLDMHCLTKSFGRSAIKMERLLDKPTWWKRLWEKVRKSKR